MAQLKYWMWLSCKNGISPSKKALLLNHFGTLENMYYAESAEYRGVAGLNEKDVAVLTDKGYDEAERVLGRCDELGIKLMTIQDADYPDRLKNIDVPPLLLYYKGNMPAFDEEIAIAVIGTRSCTAYGELYAEKLSFEIARGGGYIVSGMARGLDSRANLGALKAGKPTAAVLGCGVDVIYPPENRNLYMDIVAAGVVISEYPPGTEPYGSNFPARNRIMSGLSLGVLVVEAPEGSGALITANHAIEQGRDVFAVPGALNMPASEGSNALIRDGEAKLVMTAWDVLSEYTAVYPHKIAAGKERADKVTLVPEKISSEAAKKTEIPAAVALERENSAETAEKFKKKLESAIKDFTETRQKIILTIVDAPKHVDDIIEVSGLEAREVMSELTIMELDGITTELPGRRFSINSEFLKD